jgi:2-polyprenyl-6-methoxyphenol hydroxylase-like FAD-dependent oxidoreductase
LQGAALLAKELHANEDYQVAFSRYNELFKPYVEGVQARVDHSLKIQLPETEEELQASLKAWAVDQTTALRIKLIFLFPTYLLPYHYNHFSTTSQPHLGG